VAFSNAASFQPTLAMVTIQPGAAPFFDSGGGDDVNLMIARNRRSVRNIPM
jgi:hypothetical protein